jgi:hypothetical protein
LRSRRSGNRDFRPPKLIAAIGTRPGTPIGSPIELSSGCSTPLLTIRPSSANERIASCSWRCSLAKSSGEWRSASRRNVSRSASGIPASQA